MITLALVRVHVCDPDTAHIAPAGGLGYVAWPDPVDVLADAGKVSVVAVQNELFHSAEVACRSG